MHSLCYKSLTIEQLLNYNNTMNDIKSDCQAININIIEKVRPNMPEDTILYELSDFLKLWAMARA